MGGPGRWDAPDLRVSSDRSRIAKYRRLQSWYREMQLGIPGAGVGANRQSAASMLPAGALAAEPDLNFLTPPAYQHAKQREVAVRATGGHPGT